MSDDQDDISLWIQIYQSNQTVNWRKNMHQTTYLPGGPGGPGSPTISTVELITLISVQMLLFLTAFSILLMKQKT